MHAGGPPDGLDHIRLHNILTLDEPLVHCSHLTWGVHAHLLRTCLSLSLHSVHVGPRRLSAHGPSERGHAAQRLLLLHPPPQQTQQPQRAGEFELACMMACMLAWPWVLACMPVLCLPHLSPSSSLFASVRSFIPNRRPHAISCCR